LGLALVAFSVWIWAIADWDSRGFKLVANAAAMIVPVATLPLARRRAVSNAALALGAVEIPRDAFPDTASALHDMAVASGGNRVRLALFVSKAVNAFVAEKDGTTTVNVSTAYTSLPIEEQRAGFAMLLGRQRVAIDSVLVGSLRNVSPTTDEGVTITRAILERDPTLRHRVCRGYVEAAVAGDREALMMLKEPGPLFTLLARLADSDRVLPNVEVAAAHLCLAWPFITVGTSGAAPPSRMTLEAHQRLAEIFGVHNADFGDPDYQRLQRLQTVVPAGETVYRAPKPLPSEADPEAAAALAARREAAAKTAAAAAAARQKRLQETARGPRVAARCPKCGADNAPFNRRCIVCDAALAG
jgi:hypothetical protein